MMFVVGTRGAVAENAWASAKARFDAETFWYRGNGSIEIVRDEDFVASHHAGRNVILYGNESTNSAWSQVLRGCPITVRRGVVRVGTRTLEGEDLACLFVYPRAGERTACVGVVSGTGLAGMRTTDRLPYFVSGIHYPDWTVIGAEMPQRDIDGVRAAGFFGPDWSLDSTQSGWRDG